MHSLIFSLIFSFLFCSFNFVSELSKNITEMSTWLWCSRCFETQPLFTILPKSLSPYLQYRGFNYVTSVSDLDETLQTNQYKKWRQNISLQLMNTQEKELIESSCPRLFSLYLFLQKLNQIKPRPEQIVILNKVACVINSLVLLHFTQ